MSSFIRSLPVGTMVYEDNRSFTIIWLKPPTLRQKLSTLWYAMKWLLFTKAKKPPALPPSETRTQQKGEKLSESELVLLQRGHCPDCLEKVVEGPSGGMSINFYCGSEDCGSRFNDMGPFGADRISDASPKNTSGIGVREIIKDPYRSRA